LRGSGSFRNHRVVENPGKIVQTSKQSMQVQWGVLYGYSFTGFGKNVKHEKTNVRSVSFPQKIERVINRIGDV